ncbi:hypothetical protein D9M70_637410 [compost metagenome]
MLRSMSNWVAATPMALARASALVLETARVSAIGRTVAVASPPKRRISWNSRCTCGRLETMRMETAIR